MLKIENIGKTFYSEGAPSTRALQSISLTAEEGDFLSIVGPNGCGKSTLLNIISGEIKPDPGGSIYMTLNNAHHELTSLSKRERSSFLARVDQDPRIGTVGDLAVWENLWLATKIQASTRLFLFGSRAKTSAAYGDLLAQLGLEDRLNVKARDLSGGQRQVIGVLLAVLRKPALLLLDEHTASLDRRNASLCLGLAKNLSSENNAVVLSVTHNLSEALDVGDRLLVMREGALAHNFSRTDMDRMSVKDLNDLINEGRAT